MSIYNQFKKNIENFELWNFLSTASKVYFILAVFFTYFSTMTAMQIFPASRFSGFSDMFWILATAVILTSATLLSLLKKKYLYLWMFLAIIAFGLIVGTSASFRVKLTIEEGFAQQQIRFFCIFVTSFLSYSFFLQFIQWEGKKSVQTQTTLKLAQEIHETLVPAIEEISEKLNIYGLSESIESMGGDLIDYISLDGQRTVYIADVSGHGVSAGIIMSMFKGAMRTMAQDKQTIDRLFTKVNHALTPIKKKNMFLTAAVITFDDNSSTAMISSAGHLPVLHFSTKTEGFYRHHVKQIPLGVTEKTEYKGLQVPYDPGDYFVLLTDGLTENKNNFDNLAMLTTIEECLTPKLIKNTPLDTVSKELFADMKKQGEPIDDRSIIVIKCL